MNTNNTQDPIFEAMRLWGEGHEPQPAVEPVYYPAEFAADFRAYHPQDLDRGLEFKVKFELVGTSSADAYLWIDADSRDWDPASVAIMRSLKLRPVVVDGELIAVEDTAVEAPEISGGWKVQAWRTQQMKTASNEDVFLDEITWRRTSDGRIVKTAWPWRVYDN